MLCNADAPCFVPDAKQPANVFVSEFEDTHGAFDRGTIVLLFGLLSEGMNGLLGEILSWDEAGFRFRVRIGSGECKAVRPENLAAVGSKIYECYMAGVAAFDDGGDRDGGSSECGVSDFEACATPASGPAHSHSGGRKARRRKKEGGGDKERGSVLASLAMSSVFAPRGAGARPLPPGAAKHPWP